MGVCDQNVLQRKIFTVLEECPLKNHNNCKKRPSTLKGPLRVIRLCVLGIFLPSLFIAVPLYMRYHVYGHQLYPLAMSDMRLIDNKVSTTWCQRQLVKVNTTFNAFLLENSPSLASHLKPLTMVRHLSLEDDTKEYWGFYLLQGSSVTVSTCMARVVSHCDQRSQAPPRMRLHRRQFLRRVG
jgi:hypothetical protein